MHRDRSSNVGIGRARRASQTRWLAILAIAVASIGVTAVAYGDDIVNDLPASVDSTVETMNLTVGGSNGSTTLRVVTTNGDGKNGCNLTGATTLVIKAKSSDTSKATVPSQDITFTGCGDTRTVPVTPVAAGSSNITFELVSNSTGGSFNLAPAAFTAQIAAATVSKTEQTITFGELTGRTYGDADVALNASANSGLGVTYTSTPTAVCEIVPANLGFGPAVHLNGPGTCSVTATQGGNDSFNAAQDVTRTFEVAAKTLSGSFTAANKVYDGNTSASISAPTLSGVVGSDFVNLSGGSAAFDTKDVGNDKTVTGSSFSLTGTDAAKYTLGSVATTTANITKKAVDVNANDLSRVYGENSPAASATYAGFVTGEDKSDAGISGEASCSVPTGLNVGVHIGVVDCQPGNLSANNYSFVAGSKGNLTITARPVTVTANSLSKTYGDNDPSLTHTVTSGSLLSGHSLSGSLTRAAGEDAGTYAITQGTLAAPNANYTLTFVAGTFTINKRPITIKADPKSKVFGEADPALTYQLTNGSLVGNDSLSGALARSSGETVGTWPINQGTVSAGLNYNITFVGADLTISAWTLVGFHEPIGLNNSFLKAPRQTAPSAGTSTVWQTAKGGSVIPLKFNVFAGQAERTNVADIKSFGSTKLASCPGATTEGIEELASAGSTSLRYDTTGGQFIQNWKTPTVSGDTCYRVALTTQDDSAIYTFVKLRK